MKKTLLLLSVLLPLLLQATDWKGMEVKMWNEGDITWADFKGVRPQTVDAPMSHFECILDVRKENLGHGREYFAYAYMSVFESYVADSAIVEPQQLQYYQLQFDALEMVRRLLQNDIGLDASDEYVQERLAYYRALYREQLQSIEKETDAGADERKVVEWMYFTHKNLEQYSVSEFPHTVPSKFGYGVSIGLGGIFPLDGINDTFNGNFTFNAGLVGIYRRLQLQGTVSYGQPGLSNRNVFNKYVDEDINRPEFDVLDNNASFLDFTVSLGYAVVKTERFAMTPHFGLFWGKYKWTATHLEYTQNSETGGYESSIDYTETQKFKNLNWMAGIDFDIKFATVVSNDEFWFGRREQLSSVLRITPYVAHAVYNKENPAVKGYYFGFTVSYLGLAQALKLQ